MKAKQILLVLIVLIGIGLYALPSTVSLFAGQHSFQNIDAAGNQIDCEKCHADVAAELRVAGAPHSDFTCAACHRIALGKASGDDAYSEISYTATGLDGVKATRKLIVLAGDMYAKNVPAVVLSGDTPLQVGTQPTLSGNAMWYSTSTRAPILPAVGVSPCYPATAAACVDGTTVMTVQDPATFQLTMLTGKAGLPNARFQPNAVTYSVAADGKSVTANFSAVGARTSNPGTGYHAAAMPSCLVCHGGEAPQSHHDAEYSAMSDSSVNGCVACHYEAGSKGLTGQIVASGFNMTPHAGDTGVDEVHKDFQTTNDDLTESQVCSMCHTHGLVDITYTKPTTTGFDVGTDGAVSTVVIGGETITNSP